MGGDDTPKTILNMLCISIHTTRVGGDRILPRFCLSQFLFQSTPPVWVVTKQPYHLFACDKISIHTTRVGGDTINFTVFAVWHNISIHTTRVGGDSNSLSLVVRVAIFQSTPPVWVVTLQL